MKARTTTVGGGGSSWLRIETVLVVMLVVLLVVFGRYGRNFWTVENFFEVIRLTVEIGLIAMVMTPVVLSGGIDLSVGSLLGLCGVVFGTLWRDVGMTPLAAAAGAIGVGALGGCLNGLLITRLRLPPLIVTLGSYSLFRGLAEAMTGGVDNFTGFPRDFLFLGQGYWFGFLPAQVPIFLGVSMGVWVLVHRTTMGRALRVIGYGREGAIYAGLPVDRHLLVLYTLAGLVVGCSSMIYVAHVGQAKADAGTGYELLAVTAVVLGGTSIFGGRGSVQGTFLGLMVLAVLKNGMTLSDLPSELVGIVTGLLLLTVLTVEVLMKRIWKGAREGEG